MAGPVFTGQIGVVESPGSLTLGSSQLGRISLGGSGPFTFPPTLPALDKSHALPLIGHLYTNSLTFKKSLGALINRPKIKWTLNSGHHPVTIELSTNDTSAIGPSQGDIVRLTEQGGDGRVIYTGIIADIDLNIDARPPFVALQLDPLVTELGEAPFDHNYTTNTDIAQMVRDAVSQSTHCTFTPQSIPDTGIFEIFNFHVTNALEVLNTCKHMGGPNFFFFVDEYGVVWFQAVSLAGKPAYTLASGFTARRRSAPISTLKNFILTAGGLKDQEQDGLALSSQYKDPASILKYGQRFLSPPLYFPAAVSQSALDAITFNIGTILNRIRTKVTVTLPTFGNRFLLGRFGGPSIRYWEPSVNPMGEPIAGTGSYSPNYVILEVEMDGPLQTLILGDLPVTADDFKYMVDGHVAKMTQHLNLYPPLSTTHYTIVGPGGILASEPGVNI